MFASNTKISHKMTLNVENPTESTSGSFSPQLKVFFHAVDGIGHLNACVGLAQVLAKRGHRIYFLLNDAFAGQFAKFGFDEILLKQKPKQLLELPENPEELQVKKNPVKKMAEMLIKAGFLGPKSPLEKMKDQLNSDNEFMETIYDQAVEYNPQIADAIEKEKPDMFILDSFLIFPAILLANIPWILLFSAAPTFLYKSDKVPPFGSGYASDSDPTTWQEFIKVMKEDWKQNFTKYQDDLYKEFNYEEPEEEKTEPDDFSIKLSPYLNVYGYPAELDYNDITERPANLAQLDAFLREEKEAFEVPETLNLQPGDKLIYVSLGSMGSIDVDLMKRITAVLAKTPYKYIVSKGQRGDEYDLPSNCWGENFLPQTRILPLVDLVITHGGNNTITETFSFGKPMIVMPLFGDQYDNAQRVHEKGYGIRMEPYQFTESQLISTINQLLNNTQLANKVKAVGERMSKSNSKERVVEQLEQIVAKFKEQQQNA